MMGKSKCDREGGGYLGTVHVVGGAEQRNKVWMGGEGLASQTVNTSVQHAL